MSHCDYLRGLLLLIVAGSIIAAPAAIAQEVWSGTTYTFEKVDFADWTLPENQDRITPNVWLTRKDTQGLFNIAQESGYSGGAGSPVDTEWATGAAADWASLTFAPWNTWSGGSPPSTIGVDAVVHLITDDIYVDIVFLSWSGGGPGGGFSYMRGEEEPVATDEGSWGELKSLY